MNSDFPLLAQALEQGLEAGSAGGDVEAVLGTLGLQNAAYHSFEPLPDKADIAWVTSSAALIGPTSAPTPAPEPPREAAAAAIAPRSGPLFSPPQSAATAAPALSPLMPAAKAAPALSPMMPAHEREPALAPPVPAIPTPRVAAAARQMAAMQTADRPVTLSEVFQILSGRPAAAVEAAPRSLRDVFGAARRGL